MAVDLVNRLCQVTEVDPEDPSTTHIPLETFLVAIWSIASGHESVTNVKTFFDMPSGSGAQDPTDQQTSFDMLLDEVFGGHTAPFTITVDTIVKIHRMDAILKAYFASEDFPGLAQYDSPDDVQTQLLDITP
jgi:hypothetical protein